jgi:hypothetical protein
LVGIFPELQLGRLFIYPQANKIAPRLPLSGIPQENEFVEKNNTTNPNIKEHT